MENEKIRLEVKIGDRDYALEGTKAMVLDMLSDLEKKYERKDSTNLSVSVTLPHRTLPPRRVKTKTTTMDVPTVEQLVDYILTKVRYEHNIVEVEDVFWGKKITARENQLLYRKLHDNLGKARHKIETMKQGKFEQQLTSSRNLKKYIFRPIMQTLTQTLNGKTEPTS